MHGSSIHKTVMLSSNTDRILIKLLNLLSKDMMK